VTSSFTYDDESLRRRVWPKFADRSVDESYEENFAVGHRLHRLREERPR
jgi:hypothetical protein